MKATCLNASDNKAIKAKSLASFKQATTKIIRQTMTITQYNFLEPFDCSKNGLDFGLDACKLKGLS